MNRPAAATTSCASRRAAPLERAALDRKTRRAFQVLILQRGRNPGVKGWEMRRYLGKDYKAILEVLSDDLKPLGLEVHQVPGPEGTDDSTRFLLRFRDPPTLSEAETAGFRIDDLAVLAASIALVNSKQGGSRGRSSRASSRASSPGGGSTTPSTDTSSEATSTSTTRSSSG